MAQMYECGADEEQVEAILGIAEKSTVREHLQRLGPTLVELLEGLV